MRLDILTIFPEMFEGPFSLSMIKRAINKKIVEIHIHNIRDYTADKHKRVDDYAYGPGAGMVMMIQPIADLIDKLKSERDYDEIIFTTPDGDTFNQETANTLSLKENIIILCGHYKGVDQRLRDMYITKELSIGDYVLTGGELAAMVMSDAIIRVIPGVLSDETSALTDSFQSGLLSPPVYTRPPVYKGVAVPDILLSGNDKEIANWRLEQSLEKTRNLRPDLYEKLP
ncbi:MAG: tRNA (guanosine(37)-N1)-methyltransferase TrmD [Bacteroidales bacterium]|jgi:tRNA (guanine37-N1)-methyltransferase|nr:tRNA (guanosine(37)-N1)-methyltransferase TrmD [Bacteroidales bacterium]MDD2205332.1 tRNA (guanosine(37)-N1)-methyltransferase TrmD [Bacteroidales bacterium]MDD3152062.1 tRNA (guanosine(37)-N1)-methyltransferase TrmD [Bacteroidales bacterium]MDD3914121.1 tRNA (guanosine(37)-N1)-methyltransferase TrmD [Bacteroidales bacterium]MDD4634073.1 tRNA (guanosine(37)-N1)-methyltransferase TrmD [Bacteroidales bacterium]